MVSSLWLVNKNDRSGLGLWGGHFLLLWISLKIVHADNTLTPPKRQDKYIIERQISQSGDKNRNFLPKNFVLPVDKSGRWGYYKCNITKMAVKRRVGLRIDPYQKARAMEKGGKQEAENGLGAVRARRMSAKSATGAPVTASGCKQHCCRSIEAVPVRVR